MGTLYYGDNLDILRRYLPDATVDLVYLDPPFNSAQNYNALTEQPGKVSEVMQAFRTFLGTNDRGGGGESRRSVGGRAMACPATMAPHGVELRLLAHAPASLFPTASSVLKPTGSLYLHCDPTASHYLKLLLDAVFGPLRIIAQRFSAGFAA